MVTDKDYLEFDVGNNKLEGAIPSEIVSSNISYSLNLAYNKFTFEGLELVQQSYPFAFYYHQKRIPIHISNNTLSVSAGGKLSNNTYTWYMLEQPGKVVITGDSTLHPKQSGTYYVKITNAIATGLILKSDTINYTLPLVSSYKTSNELHIKNRTQQLSVFPNPAKDILHVQTKDVASVSLIDQSGKILLTKNVNGSGTLNISNIAAGIYFLKNNSNGEVKKVIITR